jgi:hypothetical protein
MVALLCFWLTLLTSPFKSRSRLEAENAALRRQVTVLRRKVQGRIQLTNADRLFFIQLYRWFPSILKAITIIQPETIARWHRAGSPLLAVEISLARRPATNRRRPAGSDPADERGQSPVGSAAHPR